MRLILISACTFAAYTGVANAQDNTDAQDAPAANEQVTTHTMNYAADSSNMDRARNYARDAQRVMRERADTEEADAPLPIGEAVIQDEDRRSGPDL
ncbi:MAG: hypothetical protein GYB36_07440 [Alphaproteobacteria bacterium]|nr:hypothetical protein [Alphaproteobacteria bacterium]